MEKNADSDAQLTSHNISICNLEVQICQISQALNSRPKGALPSDTVVNPKGGNNTGHAMAVTTRSGRGGNAPTSSQRQFVDVELVVEEEEISTNVEQENDKVRIDIDDMVEETQEDVNPSRDHVIDIPEPVVQKAKAPLPKPPPPYPLRLTKKNVDYEVLIILGRPFLTTGKALVDAEDGELTFRVGDENVVFHVCNSMRQPNSNGVCSFMDLVTNVIIDDTSATINKGDMLEALFLNFDDDEMDGFMECVNSLQGMGSYNYAPQKLSLDLDNRKTPPTKPSIEDPLILELKPCLHISEFDIDIQDRKGSENQVADHLSRLEGKGRPLDGIEINDSFPDEQLLAISMKEVPWFIDLANFLVYGIIPDEFSSNKRKKLKRDYQDYYWDEPYLFRICTDGVTRRCVSDEEQHVILDACHSSPYGGHHGGARTEIKVLSYGFYWPTLYKNASNMVKRCDECQRADRISKKNEIPLTTILEIDIFEVWGIDFMGPFVSSCGNTYILVAVDYVSK
ncbi:uncharacterized protein [Nicotiana tomentosiformis]|uniref:uncharacterized protein n=1 Tax=Nicotiana tomentosiformis TaxID=4098 RepID=UPI00388C8BD2